MNKHLTIQSASQNTGFSQQYIRHAIRSGALKTELAPLNPENPEGTKHHVFTQEDFDAWRNGVGTKPRREDGRKRFVLYATPEELANIKEAAPKAIVRKPVAYKNKKQAV